MLFVFLTVLIVLTDVSTKKWVMKKLKPGQSILIYNCILLKQTANQGFAFSILKQRPQFVKAAVFLANSSFIIYIVLIYKKLNILEKISLSFVAGGGLGNLIDRLRHHGVTDFIQLQHKNGSRSPIINMADLFIFIGAALMGASLFIQMVKPLLLFRKR